LISKEIVVVHHLRARILRKKASNIIYKRPQWSAKAESKAKEERVNRLGSGF